MYKTTTGQCSYAELPNIKIEISNLLNEEEKEKLLDKCGRSCFGHGSIFYGRYFCYYHLPFFDSNGKQSSDNLPSIEENLDSEESTTITDNSITQIKVDIFNQLHLKTDNNFIGYSFPTDFDFSALNFSSMETIDFRCANLNGKVYFAKKTFQSEVSFSGATFQGRADFSECIFEKRVHFKRTVFKKHTHFTGVTFQAFTDFIKAKFNDRTNFIGTTFGIQQDVNNHDPLNAKKEIDKVTFNFNESEFKGNLNFSGSRFIGLVNFSGTKFLKSVTFEMSSFEDQAVFVDCVFKEDASFKKTTFGKENNPRVRVSFSESDFFGEAFFSSKNSRYSAWANAFFTFDRVSFKNINQTRFISVPLNSSGFIRTDPRKIEFTNVKWGNAERSAKARVIQEIGLIIQAENEILTIFNEIRVEISDSERSTLRMLSHTCRRLAVNAEEDHRYKSSSIFRSIAFECERLERKEKFWSRIDNFPNENEKLKRRFGGSNKEEDKEIRPSTLFGIFWRSGDSIIHKLYKITSFYGESWEQAALFLLFLILVVFPIIYTRTDFQVSPKTLPLAVVLNGCKDIKLIPPEGCEIKNGGLGFWNGEAVVQSLAIATLQNVEYRKPITGWGELWQILEKIIAPLQATLLALAIRRKFMR